MDDPKRLKIAQSISYVDLIASSIEMQIKMNEWLKQNWHFDFWVVLFELNYYLWWNIIGFIHMRLYWHQINYGNLLGQVAYSVNLSLISSNVNYNRTKSHSDTAIQTCNENGKKSFIELKCFCNSQDFLLRKEYDW